MEDCRGPGQARGSITALVMNRLLLRLFLALSFAAVAAAAPRRPKLPAISFATVDEGRAVLTARDDFVVRLSPFDRAVRVETGREVSEQDYLRFVRGNVLAWNPEDKKAVESAWSALAPRLVETAPLFPPAIDFIETTGREEGGAEYTRANAIILPRSSLDPAHRASLEGIVAHELFHVLSRNNPDLRDELYAVIGFQPCGEIPFPTELAGRKITNPDAPRNDHCIRLQTSQGPVWAVPLLFSSLPRYEAREGGPFFRYLEFKFLVVERTGSSPSAPATYDVSSPVLLGVNQVRGFYEQVGRNTDYVIHPEEILADNFKLLLLGRTKVPSPEVLEKLAAVLRESAAAKP